MSKPFPIVKVTLPSDLKGCKAGEIPANLLRNIEGKGKLHHLAADAYEAMDKARKTIYADLEGMSRETIPEMLAEAGVTNITVQIEDLNYRFGKSQRVSVSMLDKDAGMDWLKANGGEGLIKPTVNAAQLSSFAKEFLKTKGMDLPLETFKTSSMTYTSITKAG